MAHQHPDNVSVYTIKSFLEVYEINIYALSSLKPACSSRSFSPSAPFILCNRICEGTYRSVIPLQFLHFPKSPFFGIFTRYTISILLGLSLVPRSSGMDGATYLLLFSGLLSETLVAGRLVLVSFRDSGGRPSGPGVFQSLWWYAVWSLCLSEPLVVCCLVLVSFRASGGMLSGPGVFQSLWWYAVWSWRLSEPLVVCCLVLVSLRASGGMPSGPGVFQSLWWYAVWSWRLSGPLVVCRLVLVSFRASGGMPSGPGVFQSLWWYAVLSWCLSEPLVVCRLVLVSFSPLKSSVLYLFQHSKVDLC